MRLPIQTRPVMRKIGTASISVGLKPSQIDCEEFCSGLTGAAWELCMEMWC